MDNINTNTMEGKKTFKQIYDEVKIGQPFWFFNSDFEYVSKFVISEKTEYQKNGKVILKLECTPTNNNECTKTIKDYPNCEDTLRWSDKDNCYLYYPYSFHGYVFFNKEMAGLKANEYLYEKSKEYNELFNHIVEDLK